MIIKIEVEHAIAKGREVEALEILRELSRRGLDRPADATWRGLFLQGDFRKPELAESCREDIAGLSELGLLLDTPVRIRVHVSS